MIRKPNKYCIIPAVIILLVVFVPWHQASASFCPASIRDCVISAQEWMQELVGKAIGWAAQLLDVFLQNQPISGVFVVDQSWTIIRNFVNLFFILILIIMAFGTIFNIRRYTWKDMLAPFLIAALLINFSLVIGQYIAGVANGLSGVFLREIGQTSITAAQGSGIQKLATSLPTGADLLGGAASVAVSGIFSLVFLIIVFLAFLSVAIFSIVRLVAIWFLLIISPLAWFGYALPNLRQKTWSAWWKHFLCWCFFLPYYLFFMMFAVGFVKNKNEIGALLPTASGPIDKIFGSPGAINDFLFYVLSLIFLVGGLAMAMKLACASGTGVKAAFSKIETGVRKYAPGAAYVSGAKEGLKERGAEIMEKGLFGIGGAQKARIQEAEAKGFVAGIRGPGRVPGAREEGARTEMVEIEKEVKRTREQLLRLPADQQKAFLEAEKSKRGVAGQAAALEYVKQGYSTLADYQEAVKRFGGENSTFMQQYLENIKQAKLGNLFKSPDEELRIARGEASETRELVNLRRELYKDLAKRNQINDIAVYKQAKQLLSPIPAELKSFLDSVKPEHIVGTRDARQDAIRNRTLDDPELERKLVEFMKDKKEINDVKLRQSALDIVKSGTTAGKDTIEGRNIINEINKFNPIINIEANLREEKGVPVGPLDEESQNRIVRELSEKISEMESGDIRKMSGDFFKNPAAQEAFRQTFDSEELSELLKNAPKEMRRALKDIAGGGTPGGGTAKRRAGFIS